MQRRYHPLIVAHLSASHRLATGLHAPPSLTRPFAAVQAAWRFYGNPSIGLPQLAGPLIDCARVDVAANCADFTRVAMDGSPLRLGGHDSKQDRIELAHSKDLGYDLLTALAMGDHDGSPIAPLCLELRAKDGVHSTRAQEPLNPPSSLDSLAPVMAHVKALALDKPPVFIIDREADSVGHYRAWDAAGRRFLVRANDPRWVLHEGQERRLSEVADTLKRRQDFSVSRQVLFQGKPATQFIAETIVVLHRPARTHRLDSRTGKKKHKNIPGPPITLPLIVSEIRDEGGKVLARWLLLTNLPACVDAATVALWYYWRWRIESYHKLLKGDGQQVEDWLQETAAAFSRRLRVAAMSMVVLWRLAREDSPQAAQMREVLVRLSGRQMKRTRNARPFTEPALLAGLGGLVSMLDGLRQYSLSDLYRLAEATLPGIINPPRTRRTRAEEDG